MLVKSTKRKEKNDVMCPTVEMLKFFSFPVGCIMRGRVHTTLLRYLLRKAFWAFGKYLGPSMSQADGSGLPSEA